MNILSAPQLISIFFGRSRRAISRNSAFVGLDREFIDEMVCQVIEPSDKLKSLQIIFGVIPLLIQENLSMCWDLLEGIMIQQINHHSTS
ncbi:hypothetical protein FGO68_gene9402 [Halteria grandinella]|uniref:Uncharacterized protein n=1 Tax=Halteria grandinella TaxID=5974 RepID=A0A8J8NJT0_HALGN|nr:hypothetical protein FGO68_gene9402 [Halteria grandinella]